MNATRHISPVTKVDVSDLLAIGDPNVVSSIAEKLRIRKATEPNVVARIGLHKAIWNDFTNRVEPRLEALEPVLARLIERTSGVVFHCNRMRFLVVEMTVVIEVRVNRHTRQATFTFIALAVAVLVQPLRAVYAAGTDGLVAKIESDLFVPRFNLDDMAGEVPDFERYIEIQRRIEDPNLAGHSLNKAVRGRPH